MFEPLTQNNPQAPRIYGFPKVIDKPNFPLHSIILSFSSSTYNLSIFLSSILPVSYTHLTLPTIYSV